MKKILLCVILSTVAGCAASPESIQPAYVSAMSYATWTCPQLAEEQFHLASALATASSQQSSARTGDALGVLLVGMPVSSMTGGNVAPQIALYKGQQEAVRQAAIGKSCPLS